MAKMGARAKSNAVVRAVEEMGLDDDGRNWVYTAKFEPERDQIGVLWGRATKRGRIILVGDIETDDGPLSVVGFPFITKRYAPGLTLCLARHFLKEGGSVRSDGERMAEDPIARRKRRKKESKAAVKEALYGG